MCVGIAGGLELQFQEPVPEGQSENSPALQRWERNRSRPSPEGTFERLPAFQPSLRDSVFGRGFPSVETLGYYRMSLRDKILRARMHLNSTPNPEAHALQRGA